jgi:outer membrane protein assembly factor BamB
MRSPALAASAVLLLAAAALAAPAAGTSPRAAHRYHDWASYHGGSGRHGYASTMPHVHGAPHVVKKLALDGKVYAAPIVIHGVIIVATENDSVYAFNSHLHRLWKRHLGSPSPGHERPCGNIDPLGITGTPVYDAKHNSVYVAPEFSGSPPRHELVSLSFSTGKVKWHRSLDLPGVDRAAMQERGALTISGSRVYVPFGGLAGDCANYKGRVVGLHRAHGGARVSFTVPTQREAGIWTPPGPTVDEHGHLYVSVGNGASGVGDHYDLSDSVLELSRSLKLMHHFSPTSWPSDNDADLDLGSQGPALVGKYVFAAGKSGTAYILRRSLGGVGGQLHQGSLCRSFGGTAVHDRVVYVPCDDGVRAVYVGSHGRMHVRWHASTAGSPVIGGGRVWSIDANAGVLHALSPKTGQSLKQVGVGATSRFATPALYAHRVYVPTLTGLTVVRVS